MSLELILEKENLEVKFYYYYEEPQEFLFFVWLWKGTSSA